MNAEDWRQVDKLFQAVVEIEPGGLSAYLAKACDGDAIMRTEVESLLTNDARGCESIERPAVGCAALLLADEGPAFISGDRVGQYEIVSLISRGGMGEVYLARDRI